MDKPTISKSVFLTTDGRSEQIAYMALYVPDLPDQSLHGIRLESEKFMRAVLSAVADSLFYREA